MIVKIAAINAAWYHYLHSYKKEFTKQSVQEYGLTYHYRIPEVIPRKKTKRSFITLSRQSSTYKIAD